MSLKVSVKFTHVPAEGDDESVGRLRVTEVGPNGKPLAGGVSVVLAEPGDFQEVVIGDSNALVLEEIQPGEE